MQQRFVEFLRVLCAFKASTQRTLRLSVTSVFNLYLAQRSRITNPRQTTRFHKLVLQGTRSYCCFKLDRGLFWARKQTIEEAASSP
jgi:hypothetical protein